MRFTRIVALVTLAFLGISSLAGGIPLILDPSGGLLGMPLTLLQHSPFRSFFFPGIILLLANGVFSLIVLWIAVRRYRGYGWWIAAQGCVLFGWISIEVVLIRVVIWAHYFYWGVALLLVGAGLVLSRQERMAAHSSATLAR